MDRFEESSTNGDVSVGIQEIKDVLSHNLFTCVKCNELLQIPVMLVKNVGNVCKNCFISHNNENTVEKWLGIDNTILNVFLEVLRIPCKYKGYGCNVQELSKSMKKHEEKCNFRTISCFIANHCSWSDSLILFSDHINSYHSREDIVIKSDNNKFEFEFDITKTDNAIKILRYSTGYVFFSVKTCHERRALLYKVYTMNIDRDIKFAKITHSHGNMKYRYVCKVFQFGEQETDEMYVEVSMPVLIDLSDDSHIVPTCIKLLDVNVLTKMTHDDIIATFQCPVCYDLMRSTIYLCKTGHSICCNCRLRLLNCQFCKAPIGQSRNFSLENLSKDILYTCMHECGEKFLGFYIQHHERSCPKRKFDCPENTCRFDGSYSAVVQHCRDEHANFNLETINTFHSFIDMSLNNYHNKVFFFLEEDSAIFVAHVKYLILPLSGKHFYSWTVRLLSDCKTPGYYYYEITIHHPTSRYDKMIKMNVCSDKSKQVEDNLTFSVKALESYKNNRNFISYSCRIVKDEGKGSSRQCR